MKLLIELVRVGVRSDVAGLSTPRPLLSFPGGCWGGSVVEVGEASFRLFRINRCGVTQLSVDQLLLAVLAVNRGQLIPPLAQQLV